MKFKSINLTVSVLLLLSISISLFAAPIRNLRCGSGLVWTGDSTSKLVQHCGQPTSVEKNENRVPVEIYDEKSGKNITVLESQPYEIWTFNFGPRRLVTRITVRNNVVQAMDSSGYGW